MRTILYGDSGSERMLHNDSTVTSQVVSGFYRSSAGVMAGYQYLNSGESLWYYVCKYNSRGGGYFSGVLEPETDEPPCACIQQLRFHTITEFENGDPTGSMVIGSANVTLTEGTAAAFLTTLFRKLEYSGQGQILYMTIRNWNGSGDGFVKTGLSMLRRIIQVLPKRLQKRLSFSANSTVADRSISGNHTQLQFLMPEDIPGGLGNCFDFSEQASSPAGCHPYLLALAKAAAEGTESHALDAIEGCIILPYSPINVHPMQLYLDLYNFLELLKSYNPNCSDAVFENLCVRMEKAWMRLRRNTALNKTMLLRSLQGICHPDLLEELMAIEQDAIAAEQNNAYFEEKLKEKKASTREYIAELEARKKQAEEEIEKLTTANKQASEKYTALITQKGQAREKNNTTRYTVGKREQTLSKLKELKAKRDRELADQQVRAYSQRPSPQVAQTLLVQASASEMSPSKMTLPERQAYAYRSLWLLCDEDVRQKLSPLTFDSMIYPPRSYSPKNRNYQMQSDEMANIANKRDTEGKDATLEQRVIIGDMLYYRLCNEYLQQTPNYQDAVFSYPDGSGAGVRISSADLIFPMLGCRELMRGALSPFMEEIYLEHTESRRRTSTLPSYDALTMYFGLAYCGLRLGTFINQHKDNTKKLYPSPKQQKKWAKLMRFDEFIKKIAALYPNETAAMKSYHALASGLGLDDVIGLK